MTIDERLEKLVGRHEALTQTIELMAREMHDTKSSIDGLKSSIDGVKSYTNEIAEGDFSPSAYCPDP